MRGEIFLCENISSRIVLWYACMANEQNGE